MKMKFKKWIIMIMAVCMGMGVLAGCSLEDKLMSEDVKALRDQLADTSVEYAKKYFDKEIDLEEFDIDIGEETAENEYEDIADIKTKNPIYLFGHFKGEPKDVLDFQLVYQDGKVIKYGIQTTDDDKRQYADLEK